MKKQLMVLLGVVLTAVVGRVAAQSAEATIHPTGGLPPWPVASKAQVLNHVEPEQKLRLVLGLEPPYASEEKQFIHDLQDKNSPQTLFFVGARHEDTKTLERFAKQLWDGGTSCPLW